MGSYHARDLEMGGLMVSKKPGKVRIIAGRWRRRMLPVPDVDGLRPTPDRVRETLFNWLSADLPGARCLDLFAGSGALGFEAASRGAARVVMIERDADVARNLTAQARDLGAGPEEIRVVCSDAARWLQRSTESFDVVFVDPPYGSQDLSTLLAALVEGRHLARHGRVFVEFPGGPAVPAIPDGLRLLHEQRAGRVRYYLAALDPSS